MPTAIREAAPLAAPPTGDDRDPLDVPFVESGTQPPVYYSPIRTAAVFYVHARDPQGRTQTVWKGSVVDGTYRFDTPRQEQWVREDISRQLNGNPPDRWKGDNLAEDDIWICRECQFVTRNTKVANDHRKIRGHTQR